MDRLNGKRMESFRRVQEFMQERQADFADSELALDLSGKLNNLVTELRRYDLTQSTGHKSAMAGAVGQKSVREKLREMINAINRTARALARQYPDAPARFSMPANYSDKDLLATAQSFIEQAEPLAADFIRFKLPPDFMTQLQGLVNTFEELATDRERAGSKRRVANSAIGDAIAEGLEIVGQLDVLVRNRYLGDKQSLMAWSIARRVGRPARARVASGNETSEEE
ncbi:MAG: hypothetical protein ACKV2V_24290 [Blastocatellia bacterium]